MSCSRHISPTGKRFLLPGLVFLSGCPDYGLVGKDAEETNSDTETVGLGCDNGTLASAWLLDRGQERSPVVSVDDAGNATFTFFAWDQSYRFDPSVEKGTVAVSSLPEVLYWDTSSLIVGQVTVQRLDHRLPSPVDVTMLGVNDLDAEPEFSTVMLVMTALPERSGDLREAADASIRALDSNNPSAVYGGGDLDGDGLPDPTLQQLDGIHAFLSPATGYIELGDADLVFDRNPDTSGETKGELGDFDGDGHADLLLYEPDSHEEGSDLLVYYNLLEHDDVYHDGADYRIRAPEDAYVRPTPVLEDGHFAGELSGDGIGDFAFIVYDLDEDGSGTSQAVRVVDAVGDGVVPMDDITRAELSLSLADWEDDYDQVLSPLSLGDLTGDGVPDLGLNVYRRLDTFDTGLAPDEPDPIYIYAGPLSGSYNIEEDGDFTYPWQTEMDSPIRWDVEHFLPTGDVTGDGVADFMVAQQNYLDDEVGGQTAIVAGCAE